MVNIQDGASENSARPKSQSPSSSFVERYCTSVRKVAFDANLNFASAMKISE